MLFEYITKSGQLARIDAKDSNDALSKATNIAPDSGVALSVNQTDATNKPLNPLPPVDNPQEKSLPETNPTSRLLQFSSVLDQAVNIAKKKRLDYQSNILKKGVAPGVRSASDFTDILSGLNSVDSGISKPIVDTALDLAKSNAGDISSIAKSAAQGGAPKQILDKILSATDMSTALSFASPYIKDKPTVPPTEKPKYSGKLEYTGADISEGASKLDASRGSDNYVDPTVYLNMYKAWTTKGGLPQDFISNYPPKVYINPANDWLPAPLRSATGSFSQDTNDISSQIDGLFK